MSDPSPVIDDLREESEELERLVAGLEPERWALATPAAGWTVAHQIGHLAWTDHRAWTAVTDPDGFRALVEQALASPYSYVDDGAAEYARAEPADLLARWREGRAALEKALREAPEGARFPWFGPPMSAASMATARLMETWAHAQDVADTLGVTRAPTARLRHIAWLGVRTRDFAHGVHGSPRPPTRSASSSPRRTAGTSGRTVPRTPRSASPAPPSTSVSWSPSAPTAPTWTSPPTAPTPTAGWTSPRRSRGRPAAGGSRRGRARGDGGTPARRQLLRLLRRPLLRPARDARRRRGRRPHRRLPRRADHADPGPRPAEGPVRRVRPHLPAAAGGHPRARPRQRRPDRHQRGRAQPRRTRRRDTGAG